MPEFNPPSISPKEDANLPILSAYVRRFAEEGLGRKKDFQSILSIKDPDFREKNLYYSESYLGDFYTTYPESLANENKIYKKKKYDDDSSRYPSVDKLIAPFRRIPRDKEEIRELNSFAARVRGEHGYSDRQGIDFVILPFDGRTPLFAYLSGLAEHSYVLSQSRWDFSSAIIDIDHDERLHYPRLAEIHPDMADAIASYAKYGIEMSSRNDVYGAERIGGRLDYYLSTLASVQFGESSTTIEIIRHHVSSTMPELTEQELVDRTLEIALKQQAYEEAVNRTRAIRQRKLGKVLFKQQA